MDEKDLLSHPTNGKHKNSDCLTKNEVFFSAAAWDNQLRQSSDDKKKQNIFLTWQIALKNGFKISCKYFENIPKLNT